MVAGDVMLDRYCRRRPRIRLSALRSCIPLLNEHPGGANLRVVRRVGAR